MTEAPTKVQIATARVAIAALVVCMVVGLALSGFSADEWRRVWEQLRDRPGGPMTFRFVLQPVMVGIAACIDGVKDAKAGRPPYFAALFADPAHRSARIYEGVLATARVILLGIAMDVIYQWIELGTFYPGEAAIIALALAYVPYVALRGPFNRLARWWFARSAAGARS
jgi:hypothetical protein